VTNYVVGMFNQRKMVVIITNKGQELCREIAKYGGRTTLLPAYGGYSHEAKEIVITITAKTMIKFLEELVFRHDPHAMFTVEDTFYAVGGQYRRISK
ncbi:MAG: YitT family protein, partial [Mailhella sp.]|nr:YitT family protein [Mailhella sp.]